LRADWRASGKKVLPAPFGGRTVWVSWYRNRFHRVRFTNDGAGRFSAGLRSTIALQGLAWLLDDWLRSRNAGEILWETSGDPTSASATPM
jgi:hypothetical protein